VVKLGYSGSFRVSAGATTSLVIDSENQKMFTPCLRYWHVNCKSVVKYISRTNSDHFGISLMSPGLLSGPASFSQTSWTPGHTTGQCSLTRHVARRSASLTKRRRADGPDDGWSRHTDPSFGLTARHLLVRPSRAYRHGTTSVQHSKSYIDSPCIIGSSLELVLVNRSFTGYITHSRSKYTAMI